ncbi:MAG: thiamine phosphate synthase [Deltaproteobacteria bacterium]|nr:thiamine phosphate synthase [Deltaproteobacteria bacterium]
MEPGLYAIVDVKGLGARTVEDFARRLLDAGPLSALQLRAKDRGSAEVLRWARTLAPWCRERGVPFYVNDRPDVAALAGAYGVHVGQEDLPVDEIRRIFHELRVGTSTHDAGELAGALATDADYVAYGPVFGTRSKDAPAPTVGLEGLRRAVALAGGRPVVAIGGITLDNAEAVRACGARAGAVISALSVPDEALPSVVRALHRALGGRGG